MNPNRCCVVAILLFSPAVFAADGPVYFERDIQPILTRGGCNSGPCHGKQRGQNGFQLSLLGFDDNFDYDALTKEARGRRLFPAAPKQSLLLQKPTVQVPHGGGKRFEADSAFYQTLLRWIATGMPRSPADAPKLAKVVVDPPDRIMGNDQKLKLKVTAHYTDGSTRDVTEMSAYQSNESAIVGVDDAGLVHAGPIMGEAAIMCRYMDKFATCMVTVPLPTSPPDELYAGLPRQNFIDGYVWDKLKRLRLTPSPPCDDSTFLRRAHLDIIGRLPTPRECREFLADPSPDRREKLVDRLLERPEYADFWANKWMDLLRPNPYRVGIKAVWNLDNWIREAFRENIPYDQFVRSIVAGQGSTFQASPATIYRDRRQPDELTTMFSQLFLGIRLECAKCHHHPFEVWGQDDFYGFAAFFAKLDRKGTGLSPPISGSEEIFFASNKGSVQHPLTGATMSPKTLFGSTPKIADDADPRIALAEWMTRENAFLGQVAVNRVWADLMGRGLVEPVDDIRATNPPANADLLMRLGREFQTTMRHDLKQLLRTITTSYVYRLSSLPNDRNSADTRYHSRYYRQRLRAEVLLDAVTDITAMPERFEGMPEGSRAVELWTHRSDSLFLDTFGRPDPNQDPPCERTSDTAVTQTLHLMNSRRLHEKVTGDKGRVADFVASKMSDAEIAEELYLLVYSRLPSDEERKIAQQLFDQNKDNRRRAIEDLLWALLNTAEFLFKS